MDTIKKFKEDRDLVRLNEHGIDVFGDEHLFIQWMNRKNIHFGNEAPYKFINKPNGIEFINARLTSIEYGDNA